MKLITKDFYNNERIVSILGYPLYSYLKKSEGIYKKEECFELFPQNAECKVFDDILKQIPTNHDLIIYARAGIGETYLMNLMLDKIIKKYNAKKPCIICHKKTYGDICALLNPSIPFYHINVNPQEIFPLITHKNKKYRGHIFNINPSTLKKLQKLLAEYEKKTELKKSYVDVIKNFNEIYDFDNKPFVFPKNIENSVKLKIGDLNLSNFIFIVQNANFITPIKEDFWGKLCTGLKDKGYDIYINNTELSIIEAVYLAQFSKGIIALRCGFSELLSRINTKKYIIYTECRWNKIEQLEEFLTLKKYPFVNTSNLYEYNILKEDLNNIITNILEAI